MGQRKEGQWRERAIIPAALKLIHQRKESNDRLHLRQVRGLPALDRTQTRHDLRGSERLVLLRHLAGVHAVSHGLGRLVADAPATHP